MFLPPSAYKENAVALASHSHVETPVKMGTSGTDVTEPYREFSTFSDGRKYPETEIDIDIHSPEINVEYPDFNLEMPTPCG